MRTLARAVALAGLATVLAMMAFAIGSLLVPGGEAIPDRPSLFDVLAFGTIFVSFPSVGVVIVWRRPENPVGWLFLAIGFAITLSVFSSEYAGWHVYAGAEMPGAALVAWLGQWTWTSASAIALPLALMLFPTGRLPSARWRPIVAVGMAGGALATIAAAISPDQQYSGLIANPFGVGGAVGSAARTILEWEFVTIVFMIGLALAALTTRFRRGGVERQQIKWLVYPVLVLVVSLALASLGRLDGAWSVVIVMLATIPIAAGIAILRYRLYDIDLVIRRTLVYGLLVAILAAVYVALVLGLQSVLAGVTGNDTLPVALSTLAIAALFGPVRGRVRAAVDRRFYRSRYDAQRTLQAFGGRVRDQVELEAVGRTLVDVASQAMRPASASVWLRGHR